MFAEYIKDLLTSPEEIRPLKKKKSAFPLFFPLISCSPIGEL